jgi:hypothetical protein
MGEIADVAKAARTALKRAFPGHKISVTSDFSINVRWTDDGPSVEQIQDTLLSAGCAEAHTDWRDERCLKLVDDHRSFWFDRYNAAERAAEQQRREQDRLEYEVQRRRENEAVIAAQRAKDSAARPIEWQQQPQVQDPSAFEAFEKLRQRAESDASSDAERSRRPTWAPPMILGEELGELCYTLGYLTDDDKWIGRLWATFATPKRSGRYLREHVSTLPLKGISCRGFQFHAGEARGPAHQILFEAQRKETGEWQFGPRWRPAPYQSLKAREWERLIRERERSRGEVCRFGERYSPEAIQAFERGIEAATRQIDAIDAEDLVKAQAHRERQQRCGRVFELARARVLDFIGAPDTQMQMAGRLWGHCCICGKELSDPISLERGIGPECLGRRIDGIKQLAADGRRPEYISMIVGMPLAFVHEVLREVGP